MVITPKRSLLDLNLNEVWRYRDLLWIFVKRDFTTFYKQTILGPLWFFIQPLLSAIVFTVIFNRIAGIPTNQIPPFLFYMSGIIAWNYFTSCLTSTSGTFTANSGLFGQVYFPRIIVPLSNAVSGLIRFGVQLIMFLVFYFYYHSLGNESVSPSIDTIILIPLMIFLMAMLGIGMGMIISSLTTKYRDLSFLLNFGTQLLMYASPIVYPLSVVPEKYKPFILANPMTPIIEGFRYAFIGKGQMDFNLFLYSIIFTIIVIIFGLILFNKVEKNFIDTI